MGYEEVKGYSAFIGMVCFMLAFVAIVWWAFKPSAKKEHEEHGNIPFKEEG